MAVRPTFLRKLADSIAKGPPSDARVLRSILGDAFTQFPPPAAEPEFDAHLGPIHFWRRTQLDALDGKRARARERLHVLLAHPDKLAHYVLSHAQLLEIYLALEDDDRDGAVRVLHEFVARGDLATRWNCYLFGLSRPMGRLRERVLPDLDDVSALMTAIEGGSDSEPAETPWPKLLGKKKRRAATKKGIADLETRMGRPLPPSYREFLAASNGAASFGAIYPELLRAEDVRWFRDENEEWIDAYTGESTDDVPDDEYFVYGDGQSSAAFRAQYLASALQIGAAFDGAVYLLNPEIVDEKGEGEAWLFANWLPGANRYRSFRELVEGMIESID